MDEFRFDPRMTFQRNRVPRDDLFDEEEQPEDEEEELSEDEELVTLFKGRRTPDYKVAWEMYEKGLGFNTQINLEETVNVNENFFIGRVA